MTPLKDGPSVLEFHRVWEDCSHRTSHALETFESTVVWNKRIPSAGAALKQEASHRQFSLAEILKWISQRIKKWKPIKG